MAISDEQIWSTQNETINRSNKEMGRGIYLNRNEEAVAGRGN